MARSISAPFGSFRKAKINERPKHGSSSDLKGNWCGSSDRATNRWKMPKLLTVDANAELIDPAGGMLSHSPRMCKDTLVSGD
jgi:hypothetical protein